MSNAEIAVELAPTTTLDVDRLRAGETLALHYPAVEAGEASRPGFDDTVVQLHIHDKCVSVSVSGNTIVLVGVVFNDLTNQCVAVRCQISLPHGDIVVRHIWELREMIPITSAS
jgi:hypothetical protein